MRRGRELPEEAGVVEDLFCEREAMLKKWQRQDLQEHVREVEQAVFGVVTDFSENTLTDPLEEEKREGIARATAEAFLREIKRELGIDGLSRKE